MIDSDSISKDKARKETKVRILFYDRTSLGVA